MIYAYYKKPIFQKVKKKKKQLKIGGNKSYTMIKCHHLNNK